MNGRELALVALEKVRYSFWWPARTVPTSGKFGTATQASVMKMFVWGVDWNFFLDLGGQKPNLPQPSYKIDTSIANPLGLMPKRVADAEHLEAGFSSEVAKSLPVRNLVRGLRLGLMGEPGNSRPYSAFRP